MVVAQDDVIVIETIDGVYSCKVLEVEYSEDGDIMLRLLSLGV